MLKRRCANSFPICYLSPHEYYSAQLYINEVVLGTAIGVIFGPHCADVFNPRSWGGDLNTTTLEVMRVTLAAGLFAIGVELPQSYLAEHAKGLLVMVVPMVSLSLSLFHVSIASLYVTLMTRYDFHDHGI